MIPFGSCVLLWRLHRGLSQAALAQKAGLPRPNLSDIERGRREVSLRTLRALALGLDVRPGVLADGLGPEGRSQPLSRESLEKVAESVARGRRGGELAKKMASLMDARLSAADGRKAVRARSGKKIQADWLRLAASRGIPEIDSLAARITEKAARP